jgi:hypothetical protein
MSKVLKDFTGREISIGDYVVVSKSTYSKTPYMDFGRVKEIEEEKAKDGSIKRFKVVYTLIATSKYSTIDIIPTKSLSTEENEMTGYIWLSKNSFNNIVKIDG